MAATGGDIQNPPMGLGLGQRQHSTQALAMGMNRRMHISLGMGAELALDQMGGQGQAVGVLLTRMRQVPRWTRVPSWLRTSTLKVT
jgi:hypothetical protein